MWEKFTSQILDSVKLSSAERAKVWAVSTAAAVATQDNFLVARNKSQQILEDKVKEGLVATAPGSLGYIIREWNEGYFAERGLVARVELTESPPSAQRCGRLPQEMHFRRLQAERKFSIVVSRQWDPEDIPPEALQSPSCASSTSPQHTDRGMTGESACSPYSTAYKPLPEFPLNSDPLLDVAAELSHLTAGPSPEPSQASQFAELEGDAEIGPREELEELEGLELRPSAGEIPQIGVFGIDGDRLAQPETQERALAEVLTTLKAMSPKQEQYVEHVRMTDHCEGHGSPVLEHIPEDDRQPSRDSSVIDCSLNLPFPEDRNNPWKTHPAYRILSDNNIGDVRTPMEATVEDSFGENERLREHHQGGTTWPHELDGCSSEDDNNNCDQSDLDAWDSRPNWPLGETLSPSLLPDNVPSSYMPPVADTKSKHSREKSKSIDQPRYGLMPRITDHGSSGNINHSGKPRPPGIPQRTRRKSDRFVLSASRHQGNRYFFGL
ncbi:hypothetical protein BST61_g1725 [Cercospora zeina]